MGAKTWMLTYSNGNAREILKSNPSLDRSASAALAKALFPSNSFQPLEDGDLSFTCPPEDEIVIGCFPGISIVAATDFGIDYPSKLPSVFLDRGAGDVIHLHAMHSVVDWFGFAVWNDRKLIRSLSLSPNNGIIEDIGNRMMFETPYWSGDHPAVGPDEDEADYPFPFHPLELGEAALREFFGYQIEGMIDPADIAPEKIPLVRYKRTRSKWRFW